MTLLLKKIVSNQSSATWYRGVYGDDMYLGVSVSPQPVRAVCRIQRDKPVTYGRVEVLCITV